MNGTPEPKPTLDEIHELSFPRNNGCKSCELAWATGQFYGPGHTYGPKRGHRPHCSCDGCY